MQRHGPPEIYPRERLESVVRSEGGGLNVMAAGPFLLPSSPGQGAQYFRNVCSPEAGLGCRAAGFCSFFRARAMRGPKRSAWAKIYDPYYLSPQFVRGSSPRASPRQILSRSKNSLLSTNVS